MRLLVFSTLYPNAAMPQHGVFVENRLNAFLRKYSADVKVIAPVPWFPYQNDTFGRYGAWARAPQREIRNGVEIFHPRYFIPPKIGMKYAPHALVRCLRKAVSDLAHEGWECDVLDAHYFYPDGVAAAAVAKEIGKPLVITARGTDINLIPNEAGPCRAILDAANRADAVITVAEALKDELVALGAPAEKISVLRNGVDLERFTPRNREKDRTALGVSGNVIVSVGHLIDRKGHDLMIDALRDIPGATLLIAGEGEKRRALDTQAERFGLADRVRFLGAVPHEKLGIVYNAADILALASSREGWPNVLLEAMACGTPCVATPVWGSREVIRAPEAGRLASGRSAAAMAAAINSIFNDPPDRAATRRYAANHSWEGTINGMATIFNDLAGKSHAAATIKTTPVKITSNASPPRLIVTVDTEEQFDWSTPGASNYEINDIAGVDRFQQVCAEAGAVPLYFLTYPLLTHEKTAAYFRTLQQCRAAACGLHLHSWATPPEGYAGGFYSFQKNLPREICAQKLAALADAYEARFSARAIYHRAGRYGVAPHDYDLLAAQGIQYDFSPSAGFDFSCAGGSDFSGYSNKSFSTAGKGWRIIVTPTAGARAIRRTQMFLSQEGNAPGFSLPRQSPLSRILQPMRLSPEGASLADLKALTRRLLADRAPVLTFTLHSTSLTPGANPYVKDAAGVERILEVTRAYFAWFQETIGGEIISPEALAAFYETRAKPRAA